ncbi:MAG TPA: cupin domain-containing protein [Acidimicrobiales bacterium]|nr:cupin domain-containing protein [Acidimicrobiales bacterium]
MVEIKPKQPSAKGPAEMFTGEVWFDSIAQGSEPSRMRANLVRFAPGARTAWHSHAVGQTLWVLDGKGLVQSRGEALTDLRPGDVVYTPPEEWHWHGAAPDNFMAHLSLTEGVADGGGPESTWGELVTDEEYRGRG